MDLLIGQNPTETDSITSTVIQIVIEQRTHSLFAGLLTVPSRSRFRIHGEATEKDGNGTECVSDDGKRYARSLLHFTAVKDFKVGRLVLRPALDIFR